MITYHDVTELRQASAEIENLAFYDPLTGCPTGAFDDTVSSSRWRPTPAVVCMGPRCFWTRTTSRPLNDTLGHEVGDLLLQQVAQRLKACVRTGRHGGAARGDEFVIMLKNPATNSEEAASLACRVSEEDPAPPQHALFAGCPQVPQHPSIGATLGIRARHAADGGLAQAG